MHSDVKELVEAFDLFPYPERTLVVGTVSFRVRLYDRYRGEAWAVGCRLNRVDYDSIRLFISRDLSEPWQADKKAGASWVQARRADGKEASVTVWTWARETALPMLDAFIDGKFKEEADLTSACRECIAGYREAEKLRSYADEALERADRKFQDIEALISDADPKYKELYAAHALAVQIMKSRATS